MICLSPAKINLGLYVTGKRSDGFHELESLVIPVPFSDLIEIHHDRESRDTVTFTSSGIEPGIPRHKNICNLAANLFTRKYSVFPIKMHLHKQIPVGAGLGGGSSNAATVLIMLNSLTGSVVDTIHLHMMAASLGSDCPFFLYNKPMLMTGRGEILKPVETALYGYYVVLLFPGFRISTKEAYQMIKPKAPAEDLLKSVAEPVDKWAELIRNDFEKPLFEKYPRLKALKESLYKTGALYASMSGSGSAIYGIFREPVRLSPVIEKHLLWKGTLTPFAQLPLLDNY